MNRRTLLLVIVVLLLAAASTWLSRQTRQEAKQAVTRNVPDYFVGDFTATQLGPDGRPVRRLEAVLLSHFPSQQIEVQQPHLTIYQPGEVPWEMTSRTGSMDDQGKLVQLAGDVHLFRTGPEAIDMATESLQVQPAKRYAQTSDPVTINSRRGHVQAVGMDAWLDEQRVVLRSRVKGVYAR